jgi:hypothetical protein
VKTLMTLILLRRTACFLEDLCGCCAGTLAGDLETVAC